MTEKPTPTEIREALELQPPEYLDFVRVLADTVRAEREMRDPEPTKEGEK